jgi:hypothetical protein
MGNALSTDLLLAVFIEPSFVTMLRRKVTSMLAAAAAAAAAANQKTSFKR